LHNAYQRLQFGATAEDDQGGEILEVRLVIWALFGV
jgi:hypothetical protein